MYYLEATSCNYAGNYERAHFFCSLFVSLSADSWYSFISLLSLYRAKYCMNNVADRGLKKSQYTSARLKKGEVLYVETLVHRSVYSP